MAIVSFDLRRLQGGNGMTVERSPAGISLDQWPWVKWVQSVVVVGPGGDAAGKTLPEPTVETQKILAYGYNVSPASEGFNVNAASLSYQVTNRTVSINGTRIGGFYIFNHAVNGGDKARSSRMRINGPARGALTKHVGFGPGRVIGPPVEQIAVDLLEGEFLDVGPDSGGAGFANSIVRVFWATGDPSPTAFPMSVNPLYQPMSG